MLVMAFTIELEIGLSFFLQSSLPLALVEDCETTLIVVGGPNDRTAIAGNAAEFERVGPVVQEKRYSDRPDQVEGALIAKPRAELAAFTQAGAGLLH